MSDSVITVEPAVDPNNRITFLLDWELTMKCNLDCDYCTTGIYGGHDNSQSHPQVNDCVATIDFALAYADLYMNTKPRGIKSVVLNVYGGEALNHPNIVDILRAVHQRYEPYQDRWQLSVTTTTNAIVSHKKLLEIIPLIDEFTVSYHTGSTDRQKQTFRDNLLTIKSHNKRLKCVVLMHEDPDLFSDAQAQIQWLEQQDIRHLPRQLDTVARHNRTYNSEQVTWFENLYTKKSYRTKISIDNSKENTDLTDTGRACCGGRQLCLNQNYRQRVFFTNNKFPDWFCGVNHFFLYIKQVNGEIYTNKDCKMNFQGEVAPIGNLNRAQELLSWTQQHLANNNMPVIQCKKYQCWCGLCAPKAQQLSDYREIMKKYTKS